MKKLHLSLLSLALVFGFDAMAITRTVSNNPNSPGQHTTVAAAITAAFAGDTILVQGSTIDYGSFTVNKQLTVIGTGHNPQKQAPLVSFFTGTISFTTAGSNSKIIGLTVGGINSPSAATGVEIRLCRVNGSINNVATSCNNWLVEGCYFASTGTNLDGGNGATISNWQVRNNVFNGSIYYFYNGGNHYFSNNIFLFNGAAHTYVRFSYFNNNIFYRANGANGTGSSGNAFNNNLSAPSTNNGLTGGTNLSGVASTDVFVTDLGTGANFSYTTNYNLVATSPGKNYGSDGTDVGVYGGVGDFNQNGIPRNPYISEFSIANPTISNGGTLNVNFKSKIR